MQNVLELQQLAVEATELSGCTGSWISWSDMSSQACPTTN